MCDPRSGAYIHPEQHRTITLREAARIQGFPDWFGFHGRVEDRAAQIGNAVPPPLARAIGAEIAACLSGSPVSDRLEEPFRRRNIPWLAKRGRLVP